MAAILPTGDRAVESVEDEPLLGRAGDARQQGGQPISQNLFIGTAVVAQVGIWLFVAIIWGSILITELDPKFSPHPLLNSAGILFIVEAILIVQPTATQAQKLEGTYWHSSFNSLGVILLALAWIDIEFNKATHPQDRFKSPHAIMGLITYILIAIQLLFGLVMFWFPNWLGGVDTAKSYYKYHRMSGYVLLVLLFATVCAATQTSFNISSLHIELWAVIVTAVLVLAGTLPRIKKGKLGLA